MPGADLPGLPGIIPLEEWEPGSVLEDKLPKLLFRAAEAVQNAVELIHNRRIVPGNGHKVNIISHSRWNNLLAVLYNYNNGDEDVAPRR